MRGVRTLFLALRQLGLRARYHAYGIEAINEALSHLTVGTGAVLERYGAVVGTGAVIHGPLIIHNAQRDYSNAIIHDRVHIGRQVLLDLTNQIEIGEDAVISMNCTLLTHQDVGDRPLKTQYEPKTMPLRIGRGSYLGAGATILHGCDIGAGSVVGAGAVVTTPVPEGVVVVGVPAKIVKRLG
jgi:maltose O-acetyltransferase